MSTQVVRKWSLLFNPSKKPSLVPFPSLLPFPSSLPFFPSLLRHVFYIVLKKKKKKKNSYKR